MKKRFLLKILFCITVCFSLTTLVSAKEIDSNDCYYSNDNNVCMAKKEYDFLSKMYWDGCQDLLTQDDYIKLKNSNLLDSTIEVVSYPTIQPYSTLISDRYKTLKILKTCNNSSCAISVTVEWNSAPVTKGYDLIGACLDGVTLLNNPSTYVYSNSSNKKATEIKKEESGFGTSLMLPTIGTNIVVNQAFSVSKGGTVYASYQHATRDVNLSDSKKYTISKYGYGKVFNFNDNISLSYERMGGVEINV